MQSPLILFLSGASGVGKTSIIEKLRILYHLDNNYVFLHFDSIGIPSFEEMIEHSGSGEGWQKISTCRWIEKIVTEYQDKQIVVIEGQTNLDFIEAACDRFEISTCSIVLIDCDWEIISERLIHNRQQPELVNLAMKDWLSFLREQAQYKKLPIVDTSHKTLEESVESVNTVFLHMIQEI